MFLNDEQKILAIEIGDLLIERNETVAVSESTTGGLLSAALLSVGGASKYYVGGGVVYTLASRTALVGAGSVPRREGAGVENTIIYLHFSYIQ